MMDFDKTGDSILVIAKDISFMMQGEMEKLSAKNGSPEGTIDGVTASKVLAALTFVAAHMAMEIGAGKAQYFGLLGNTWDFIENQKEKMNNSDAEKEAEELINKVKGMA
jgi:hypothetical protein